jgi:hypothetical protein
MLIRKSLVALIVLVLLLATLPAQAAAREPSARAKLASPTCTLPESDAEALVILANYYPNRYWWDHTDLTIAVQAHPSTTDEQLAALHGAIDTWSSVLLDCFDGLITLTDVTGLVNNPQQADIVVHFTPHGGGAVFAGQAVCGKQNCPNIMVSSEAPPAWGQPPYDPQMIEWIALHEIGHALGLGHATNLLESTDLMGYGWPDLGDPVLSQCDIDALAFVFAWALEGSAPHPPAAGPYDCSVD